MMTYTFEEVADPKNQWLLEELAHLLAYGMTEDACSRWLFSNHSRESYVSVLPSYMRFMVRLGIECKASFRVITQDEIPTSSESDVKDDDDGTKKAQVRLAPNATIRALAILIPPHGNATYDSFSAQLRAGAWSMPFKYGLSIVWRLLYEILPKMEKMHDDMFPNAFTKHHNWHLFYLVAHPNNRGQGLGKKLLLDIQREVREFNESEAEKAKVVGKQYVIAPLYLEASSHVSKRLYNRVGFEDKTDMVYGKLADGENVKIGEDGKVIGGRQFGMVWTP